MKTHMHTQVTLSLKNMKGLLWRREKARFHQLRFDETITKGHKELDMAISEMASVLFPDLAIIDGTVGMEGMGPAYGTPKKMGIIVVGNNPLSADAVATRLMGFDPEKVPHLKLSAEKGLGEIQLKKVSIQPEDYLKWEAPFDPPPSNSPSLSLMLSSMMKGPAVPAFQPCWCFFRIIIPNFLITVCRMERFTSASANT